MTNLKFLKRFLWRESQNEGHPPLERKIKTKNFSWEKGLDFDNYLFIFGLSKAHPDSWRALLNSEFEFNRFHRTYFPLKNW